MAAPPPAVGYDGAIALRTTEEFEGPLGDVFRAAAQKGTAPQSECMMTVAAACRFAGWRYKITRELSEGWIDCSTLVSQSLWMGAAVAAPFIAETQRLAYSGSTVAAGEWLPGDVLVRYPSREESPDGRHNHVGLYLGNDTGGTAWVMESREPTGVRTLPLYDEAALGGARRFLPNPTRVFADQQAALRLAAATPKLGRIGARLGVTRVHPHAHRGVDVYFDGPVEVLAPIAGSVHRRGDGSVHVRGEGEDEVVVLRGLEMAHGTRDVERGAVLGQSTGGRRDTCNDVPGLGHAFGLHVEYWSAGSPGYHEERSVTATGYTPGTTALCAYNPLYAMKLGLIGLPVREQDTSCALRLPLRPRE